MSNNKRFTKFISWWLILSMVLEMLPISAIPVYADGGANEQILTVNTDETVSTEEASAPSDANSEELDDEEWFSVASDETSGVKAHAVNFHTDEGILNQTIEDNHTLEYLPEPPVRPEAIFVGWNTAEDGSGEQEQDER